jgi:hypothetical protein
VIAARSTIHEFIDVARVIRARAERLGHQRSLVRTKAGAARPAASAACAKPTCRTRITGALGHRRPERNALAALLARYAYAIAPTGKVVRARRDRPGMDSGPSPIAHTTGICRRMGSSRCSASGWAIATAPLIVAPAEQTAQANRGPAALRSPASRRAAGPLR